MAPLAELSERELEMVVQAYAKWDSPIETFRCVTNMLARIDIPDDTITLDELGRGTEWEEGAAMTCDTLIKVVRLCKGKVALQQQSEAQDDREMMEGLLTEDEGHCVPLERLEAVLKAMGVSARLPSTDGKVSRSALERFLCGTILPAPDTSPRTLCTVTSPPLSSPTLSDLSTTPKAGDVGQKHEKRSCLSYLLKQQEPPTTLGECLKYRANQTLAIVSSPFYTGMKARRNRGDLDRIRGLSQVSEAEMGGKQGRRMYILRELVKEPEAPSPTPKHAAEKVDVELQLLTELFVEHDTGNASGAAPANLSASVVSCPPGRRVRHQGPRGSVTPPRSSLNARDTKSPCEGPLEALDTLLNSSSRAFTLDRDIASPGTATSTSEMFETLASFTAGSACRGRINCSLGSSFHAAKYTRTPTPAEIMKAPPLRRDRGAAGAAKKQRSQRGTGSDSTRTRGAASSGSLPPVQAGGRRPLWTPKPKSHDGCEERACCTLGVGSSPEVLVPVTGYRGEFVAPASPPFSPKDRLGMTGSTTLSSIVSGGGTSARNRLHGLPRRDDGSASTHIPHGKRSATQRRVIDFKRALRDMERDEARAQDEDSASRQQATAYRECDLQLLRGTSFTPATKMSCAVHA